MNCPYCGSDDTEEEDIEGVFYCNECEEYFEADEEELSDAA